MDYVLHQNMSGPGQKNPPNIKNNLKMNKSMNLFGHGSSPLEVNAAKVQGALSVESICVPL